jgi:hypothetical protein
MHHFLDIFYVSNGITNEIELLKQALSLARNNNAQLKVLLLCAELPNSSLDYKRKFKESLLKEMQDSIQFAKHPRKNIKVLVAIDPKEQEPGVSALSKCMLELSSSLSNNYNRDRHIISCWDYEPETFLRISYRVD